MTPLRDVTPTLMIKLGSIMIHAEEALESGHPYDTIALKNLLDDPEVRAWREQMDYLALLPVKR